MKTLLLIATAILARAAYAQITFSPPAGSYAGTQTVTVNCPSGLKCFYTIDGSKPSIAGFLYSTPLSVTASQTIRVIAVQTGVMGRNVGTAGTNWKCVTQGGTNFSPPPQAACQVGGGVGSIEPSAMTWTFGSPMTEKMSTTSSTGTTQALFINHPSASGCLGCTELVQDKIVQVDKGKTFILNNEMDLNVNLRTSSYNQFHTASLQCNQQGSTPQWQYDNQQGSWHNFPTAVTFGCPLSTTQQTEIRYGIHWTNGDTSCNPTNGWSTDSYDFLTICVGGTNGTGGTCRDFTWTGLTLCGYAQSGTYGIEMSLQDQPDLTNTTTSGSNPTTATRSVWNDNMTLAYYGTEQTATAAYTIGPLTPNPPMRWGGSGMQLGGQLKTN